MSSQAHDIDILNELLEPSTDPLAQQFSLTSKGITDVAAIRQELRNNLKLRINEYQIKLYEDIAKIEGLKLSAFKNDLEQKLRYVDLKNVDLIFEHPSSPPTIVDIILSKSSQEKADAIKNLRILLLQYYQLRALKRSIEFDVDELPDEVTKTEWGLSVLAGLSALSLSIAQSINFNMNLDNTAAQNSFRARYSIDGAVSEGLAIFLDIIAMSKLIAKPHKTQDEKIELSIISTNFFIKAMKYPDTVIKALHKLNFHVSAGATHTANTIFQVAGPISIFLSCVVCVISWRQLDEENTKLEIEKMKQDKTINSFVEQYPYLFRKAKGSDRNTLILKIIKNELSLREIESLKDNKDLALNIYNALHQLEQQDPHGFFKNRKKLMRHQLNIANLNKKISGAQRNLALSIITLTLTIIVTCYPPSAVVIFPTLAIISIGKFLFENLHKTPKEYSEYKEIKAEMKSYTKEADILLLDDPSQNQTK